MEPRLWWLGSMLVFVRWDLLLVVYYYFSNITYWTDIFNWMKYSFNLDSGYTTLYWDTYCSGTWGYKRKKLSATNVEQCREAAEKDSQCSDIIYYCYSNYFTDLFSNCRCTMKNQSCIKTPNNAYYQCTVEKRGKITLDIAKKLFMNNFVWYKVVF